MESVKIQNLLKEKELLEKNRQRKQINNVDNTDSDKKIVKPKVITNNKKNKEIFL